MLNSLPPIFSELLQATQKIIDKLSVFITKIVTFLWGGLVWLFERFVELFKWIADIL